MEKLNKFTDRFIKSIKPTDSRQDFTEGNGLFLRVTKTGVKSWSYVYKVAGKTRRLSLGRYPAISIAEVRQLHLEAVSLKDRGICPIEHKTQLAQEQKNKESEQQQTIAWLCDEFYNNEILKNRKAPIQIKQQIKADIKPLFGEINIHEITTPEIRSGLLKIVDRGSNVHANKVLSTMKQLFNYAIASGFMDSNPAMVITSKTIGGIEQPKTRYLSYVELKALWRYLDSIDKANVRKAHPATVIGVKVLLLTGVRTGSLIQAQWGEIDFDNNLWTIPPEHLKLKKSEEQKPHKVHLSKLTKELFQKLKQMSDCKFVIPNQDQTAPANRLRFRQLIYRLQGKIKGIDKTFTAHDFRRTISTHLSELGTQPHITELLLGHKLGGILATYNRHEYLPERKAALELWSKTIHDLVNNTNVIQLEQRA